MCSVLHKPTINFSHDRAIFQTNLVLCQFRASLCCLLRPGTYVIQMCSLNEPHILWQMCVVRTWHATVNSVRLFSVPWPHSVNSVKETFMCCMTVYNIIINRLLWNATPPLTRPRPRADIIATSRRKYRANRSHRQFHARETLVISPT